MAVRWVRRGLRRARARSSDRPTSGLVWLLALPLAVGCSGAVTRAENAPRAADETSCPHRSKEQWQAFLERYAGDARWVKTCEDQPCDAEYARLVEREIQGVFDQCEGFISRHPAIAACTKNLRDFTPTFLQQHSTTSYGFTIDNHAYLAAQESDDKPAHMMSPPPALIAAFPRRADVEAAARENGWKYLTHDSALDGVRTFVFIPDPGGKFDQWMLLNFAKREQTAVDPTTPMSFIAVQKKDRSGHDLRRVRLHFRDYNLVPSGERYHVELLEDRNGKCYSCHASGVRQLIPRRTPVLDAAPVKGEKSTGSGRRAASEFALNRLRELNERLRSYGLPDWEGRIVPAHHGPPLGAAQGCTSCHDGEIRGILTVSTSVRQLEQKVYDELAMPPTPGLVGLLERGQMKDPAPSPEEARTLDAARTAHARINEAFDSARLPELRRWLLETPCR